MSAFQQYLATLPPTTTVLAVLAIAALYYIFSSPRKLPASSSQAIVISGCDSGLGLSVATTLHASGFTVFAGCLTAAGVKHLKALGEHMHAFPLDITKERDVEEAVQSQVRPWLEKRGKQPRTLHALINSAGIGSSGLVDWQSMDTFRKTLEVNFFGHVAMTKAFLPLLKAAAAAAAAAGAPPPRVVNITSMAGILAAPGLSSYCASKYALEAFSDALRREMAPWRLPVAIIEPSFLATPILHGVKERSQALWDSLSPDTQGSWGREYFEASLRSSARIVQSAEPPSLGVAAIVQAVVHWQPSARYRAGTPATTYLPLLAALPAWASDPIIAGSSPRAVPAGFKAAQA